jgi:hypothetical protein
MWLDHFGATINQVVVSVLSKLKDGCQRQPAMLLVAVGLSRFGNSKTACLLMTCRSGLSGAGLVGIVFVATGLTFWFINT